jgi:hypothetical protein
VIYYDEVLESEGCYEEGRPSPWVSSAIHAEQIWLILGIAVAHISYYSDDEERTFPSGCYDIPHQLGLGWLSIKSHVWSHTFPLSFSSMCFLMTSLPLSSILYLPFPLLRTVATPCNMYSAHFSGLTAATQSSAESASVTSDCAMDRSSQIL